MGEVDIDKQAPNVARIKVLGGNVIPVKEGTKTLKEAVDAALTYLGSEQKEDGSYGNAESTAQVILAVNMAGRDPLNDPEFVKGDCNLGNGLLIFRKGDAFAHTTEDEVTAMATEQALLAMDAITLAGEGKTIYSAE